MADYWPHHGVNHRVNPRVTFDVPGSAAGAVSPNQQVLNGQSLG